MTQLPQLNSDWWTDRQTLGHFENFIFWKCIRNTPWTKRVKTHHATTTVVIGTCIFIATIGRLIVAPLPHLDQLWGLWVARLDALCDARVGTALTALFKRRRCGGLIVFIVIATPGQTSCQIRQRFASIQLWLLRTLWAASAPLSQNVSQLCQWTSSSTIS